MKREIRFFVSVAVMALSFEAKAELPPPVPVPPDINPDSCYWMGEWGGQIGGDGLSCQNNNTPGGVNSNEWCGSTMAINVHVETLFPDPTYGPSPRGTFCTFRVLCCYPI